MLFYSKQLEQAREEEQEVLLNVKNIRSEQKRRCFRAGKQKSVSKFRKSASQVSVIF
jgi:hypothetical protein